MPTDLQQTVPADRVEFVACGCERRILVGSLLPVRGTTIAYTGLESHPYFYT